jgi:hypothetical protein
VTQSAFEPDDYEAWLDLQDVLEERDREYWSANDKDEAEDEKGSPHCGDPWRQSVVPGEPEPTGSALGHPVDKSQ